MRQGPINQEFQVKTKCSFYVTTSKLQVCIEESTSETASWLKSIEERGHTSDLPGAETLTTFNIVNFFTYGFTTLTQHRNNTRGLDDDFTDNNARLHPLHQLHWTNATSTPRHQWLRHDGNFVGSSAALTLCPPRRVPSPTSTQHYSHRDG